VADDAVDQVVEVMKGLLVCFAGVVGKEIVDGEDDL